MTVAPVTFADIQQTLAEMQQASGASTAGDLDTGFAADLDTATGASGASASQSAGLVDELLDGAALQTEGSGDAAMSDQSDLLALLLASDGTAGLEGGSALSGTASADDVSENSGGGVSGADVVAEAESFEGTPYVWGGSSPSGFDCSGLVQYVYGQLGISLPRTSEEQAQAGTAVPSLADAQPGDLLFFAGSDGTASSPGHVGIYIGNGEMIDAPYTGTDVQVQPVSDAGQVVAIRRVLPSDSGSGSASAAEFVTDASASSSASSSAGGTTQIGNVAVPNQYVQTIEQAASSNGIPASLLSALLYHESRFEPSAVSSAGAEGIAQFMPSTAAGMGVNPLDPTQAIAGAAQLLGSYTHQFGSYADALAAYDAGAGAVEQYGGIPPYAETQAYVPAVLSLAGLSGTGGGEVS